MHKIRFLIKLMLRKTYMTFIHYEKSYDRMNKIQRIKRAILILQKAKNDALSNFTESPHKRSPTLTMNGQKQARHGHEWKLKRKNIRETEIRIEFKYILNFEPQALTGRNERTACSKYECFLISLVPLTDEFARRLNGLFSSCLLFIKQFVPIQLFTEKPQFFL